jgi:HlyD family type I secretion membrane fusion protein
MSQNLARRTPATNVQDQPKVERRPTAPVRKLRREIALPGRLAVLGGLLFFGVLGGWAATAPLAGAAVAPGIVSFESVRFTIQHLEGGIIQSFRVKEGDQVNMGDELVILADVAVRANRVALTTKLYVLAAQETRLNAERTGAQSLAFQQSSNDPAVIAAQQQELNRFNARRASAEVDKSILLQRIEQLNSQVVGHNKQLDGNRRQQALLKQEVTVVEDMYNKGLERLPRLLLLKRALVDAEAKEGELMATLSKVSEAILELEAQIKAVDVKRRDDIDAELSDVRAKRIAAEEELKKVNDQLERTIIRSPVSGTVLSIKFRTERGVVRAGEPIMDIVPSSEPLIINARLPPKDISDVKVGMPAWVVFPTYSRQTMMRITGQVRSISPDVLQDDASKEKYYMAKVEVPREHLQKVAPNVELQPGLPAEVFIATSERTALEYLLQPLMIRLERSFREH